MGMPGSGCPSCSICRGASHHWILDPRPNDREHVKYKCAHCPARGTQCTHCHGEGCRECDGEGVILVEGVFTTEDAEDAEEERSC